MRVSKDGYLFEAGFKIGFAWELSERGHKKWREEWKLRLNNLIRALKSRKHEFEVVNLLSRSGDDRLFYETLLFSERKEKLICLCSQNNSYNNPYNNSVVVSLVLYLIGLYSGIFMAKTRSFSSKVQVIPRNFELFGENKAISGDYKNSDFLVLVQKDSKISDKSSLQLHVYDFKLRGAGFHIRRFLSSPDNFLIPPLSLTGLEYSYSLGEKSFRRFLEDLLKKGEILVQNDGIDLNFETKDLIQIVTYALDFLKKNKQEADKIDKIVLRLIYASTDGPTYIFDLNEEEKTIIDEMAEKARDIYKSLKERSEKDLQGSLLHASRAGSSFRILSRRLNNIKQRLETEKKSLEEELKKRNEKFLSGKQDGGPEEEPDSFHAIKPQQTIDKIRKEVENRVREFWESEPWGKVLVLLHSTGSGKTTSVRKIVLNDNSPEKLIYIYFAPRLQLLDQEYEEISNLKLKDDVEIIALHKESKSDQKNQRLHSYMGPQILCVCNNNKGYIAQMTEFIQKGIKEKKQKMIFLLTTQASTQVKSGSTLKHLAKIKGKLRREGYKIVFVLDELSGSDNGFFTLREILKTFKSFKDSVTVFVFDASLHSKKIFENAWIGFNNNNYLAPSFFIEEFEKDGKLSLMDWETYVYSGYSYPAKILNIREKFFWFLQNKEEASAVIAEEVFKIFEEIKEKKERLFVYIQDRELVQQLRFRLNQKGLKVQVLTSNFKKMSNDSEEYKGFKDYDVVIATSTLSRGVSLKENFRKVIVVINHFASVETNMLEELQAIARIRGMPNDHEIQKEVIRIYTAILGNDKSKRNEDDLNEMARIWIETLLEDELSGKLNDQSHNKLEGEIKEILRLYKKVNILKNMKNHSDLMLFLYNSFYRPRKKVISTVTQQLSPLFRANELQNMQNTLSFLEEVTKFDAFLIENSKIRSELERFSSKLLEELFRIKSFVNIQDLRRFDSYGHGWIHYLQQYKDFSPPYVLVKNIRFRFVRDYEKLQEMKRLFRRHREILKRINPTKVNKIEEWMNTLEHEGIKDVELPGLVYLPALVIALEIYLPRKVTLRSWVTRFRIRRLGGREVPIFNEIEPYSWTSGKDAAYINIPVESVVSFKWLNGEYHKVNCDFLLKLLEEVEAVDQGSGCNSYLKI